MDTTTEEALRNWDPLSDDNTDTGFVLAAQKREIGNILRSYTGYYDLFAELLQNALDAVERRFAQADDTPYTPTIDILINLPDKSITVTDNGVGMSLQQFKSFLKPSFSFKDPSLTRGNKGVGATYLAYGFNDLSVASRQGNALCAARLRRGRDWFEDHNDIVPRPLFETIKKTPAALSSIDFGTTVTLRLIGDHIRPKTLSYFHASTAEQWVSILRVHTALGGVYLVGASPPPIRTNLRVINDYGRETQVTLEAPRYLYPHEVLGKTADLRAIISDQEKQSRAQTGPPKFLPKYQQLNGFWGEWSAKEIIAGQSPVKLTRWSEEEEELLLALGVTVYGFLGFSTELWDDYNDDKLGLRKGARLLKGGLQLATRHMPQGDPAVIPLKETIGVQHQAHVIVHYAYAEPDLGRKGFQPEHMSIASKLAVAVVNAYKKYSATLRKRTGAPALLQGMKLEQWIESQRDHERAYPLVISGAGLFAPTEELPIRSVPLVEQDVVALFNQMLAAGLVRGIQILASNQVKQYDGLYRIKMVPPFSKYVMAEDNPLGCNGDQFVGMSEIESRVLVLEYKFSLDSLIEEFSTGEKRPDDIGLVVVWQLGDRWREQFEIISYLDHDHLQHRVMHGVTHGFSYALSGMSSFQVIALSDLIAYITDPNKESMRQKQLFGD